MPSKGVWLRMQKKSNKPFWGGRRGTMRGSRPNNHEDRHYFGILKDFY